MTLAILIGLWVAATAVMLWTVWKEVGRHDEHEDQIGQLWTDRDDRLVAQQEKFDDLSGELHDKLQHALDELDRWKSAVETYLTERTDTGQPTGRHADTGEMEGV